MNINGYKETVIATTDRVQVVLMLYEGTLKHLKLARVKMQSGDIMSKGTHISKATAIVTELSSVLDMEKGGEISANLRRLYDFVLQRLIQANLNNDTNAVHDAERVIVTLKDGWKEMMQTMKESPAAARATASAI
jgi:flagellar protein FliS